MTEFVTIPKEQHEKLLRFVELAREVHFQQAYLMDAIKPLIIDAAQSPTSRPILMQLRAAFKRANDASKALHNE